MNAIVTIAGFDFSLGGIIITTVSLGCLAVMAWMFATAPIIPVEDSPHWHDETQDDPRLVEAMRELGQ